MFLDKLCSQKSNDTEQKHEIFKVMCMVLKVGRSIVHPITLASLICYIDVNILISSSDSVKKSEQVINKYTAFPPSALGDN